MSAVTIAKMIQLHEPFDLLGKYPVALPTKDDIFGGVKYALMILTPSTKIIRIIPARSPEVLKTTIEIGELSPDFLQEFGFVLISNKTRTLYSTGVCFMQDRCTYEVYIDLSDLRISQEQLTAELANIEGVSKVSIESLVTEVKPSRLS